MTVLVTRRLQLKPISWGRQSILAMIRWLNDPDTMKFSEQRHKKHTFESQWNYLNSFNHERGRIREIHAGEHFIGTITAYIDKPNLVADVGILIGEKNEWGKGYGSEAWQAFCDLLLVTEVRKIEAGCMSINLGMISICEEYGMFEEGRRADHFIVEGKPYDMVQYGRLQ